MSDEIEFKKKRDRSPNYPGLSLVQALDRVALLLNKQGRHAAPPDVAIRNIGFSPTSGTGLTALAALKKFGLIDDRGTGAGRRVGLSELGRRLVLPANPNQQADLRTAALNPPIYRELWDELGPDLPDDDGTLAWKLRDRGYSESGIAEFIPRFRATVGLLAESPSGSLAGDEESDEPTPPPPNPPTPVGQAFGKPPVAVNLASTAIETMVIPIPLGPDGSAALQLPTRMTGSAWERMLRIIGAYKESVVNDTSTPTPTSESDPSA